MDLEERVAELEATLTATGMLIEYVVAPLIASHPARDEFREILSQVYDQGMDSEQEVANVLAVLARRLDERVQAHIDAMK